MEPREGSFLGPSCTALAALGGAGTVGNNESSECEVFVGRSGGAAPERDFSLLAKSGLVSPAPWRESRPTPRALDARQKCLHPGGKQL